MEFEEGFVFSVYLKEDILKNIQKLCKRTNLEIFGYLVGEIFAWKGKNYILIEDHLFLKAATASEQYTVSQIDGTAGKFDERFQKLKKKRKNGELRIVGWWHSHPDFGCFLSTTDVETQRFFFPEDYQVALVVDPIRDEFEFFNLDDNSGKGYKKISWALINSE